MAKYAHPEPTPDNMINICSLQPHNKIIVSKMTDEFLLINKAN